MAYLNKNNSFKQSVLHAHEPNIFISIPLIFLAIGSIFIGYLTKDMIIGLGSSF
jgi:NADH-ubiquinone oxidoreductase chain 5